MAAPSYHHLPNGGMAAVWTIRRMSEATSGEMLAPDIASLIRITNSDLQKLI
jgi:hypothetical protein